MLSVETREGSSVEVIYGLRARADDFRVGDYCRCKWNYYCTYNDPDDPRRDLPRLEEALRRGGKFFHNGRATSVTALRSLRRPLRGISGPQ